MFPENKNHTPKEEVMEEQGVESCHGYTEA